MNVLALGDVCGEPGVLCVEHVLPSLRKNRGVDICVCNGENSDVLGIRPEHFWRLRDAGADVVTLGNHAYKRTQILRELEENNRLLRPLNFLPGSPGNGMTILTLASGKRLCVLCLIGRLDCDWRAENPFSALDRVLMEDEADLYVVDFHAEATSEKAALAWYADGRVSALFGTHTHVQTSDERILPKGTGFITDLGMAGIVDSVLGVCPKYSIQYFVEHLPPRFGYPKDGNRKMEGALFDIDETSGMCRSVERIRVIME